MSSSDADGALKAEVASNNKGAEEHSAENQATVPNPEPANGSSGGASEDVGFDHFALIDVLDTGAVFATERVVRRFPSAGLAFSEGGMFPVSRDSNILIKLLRLSTQDREAEEKELSPEVQEFMFSEKA